MPVVLDIILELACSSTTHLTGSLFLCSAVSQATHKKTSRGPLKGALSAQKAIQGSETESEIRELTEGTDDK